MANKRLTGTMDFECTSVTPGARWTGNCYEVTCTYSYPADFNIDDLDENDICTYAFDEEHGFMWE